jgi:hypothetical protein
VIKKTPGAPAGPEHFAAVAYRHFPRLAEEMTMTRNYRKERGRETEHLVAAAFAADGWPHAEATGAGSPGRDIRGMPGVAVEVKARAKFEPMANLRQAVGNAGADVAAVVMRPVGGGPSNIDEWPAFVTFRQLRALLRMAGYGDPVQQIPPESPQTPERLPIVVPAERLYPEPQTVAEAVSVDRAVL